MKKFISMALALVMTLSLCTFVAVPEADAFEDTGELSQYAKQAIDVIQTIDVMAGYEDNTFKPEATLTRQAAAKIICNMILGPVTAKALPTNESPFPDVNPGTEWAGYISYCSHEKIINGYSDGTFKPTGALTGYAFLKMLLGALGYSGSAEGFTGGNWKVNVAKIALGIGLNKGITSDPDGENLDQGVTREDAAIYSFNTLQGDMVEYPSQNTISINGVAVSMGNGKATPQTWSTSSTSANNINDRRDTGNAGLGGYPIVQFAERYFDKLVREPAQWDTYTQDDFGRPSIKWSWKGVDIGTYSRTPDVTFVGGVNVNEIYQALHDNAGMTSGSSSASLYVNSKYANRGWYQVGTGKFDGNPAAMGEFKVERANDKALADEIYKKAGALSMFTNSGNDATGGRPATAAVGAGNRNVDRIGDGTLIEVFRNDATNHVDVCVISVYAGKVDAVKGATTKKDAYVVITPSSNIDRRPDTIMNDTSNREFETEDFEEDDVVAYTYSDSAAAIKSMYLMESESGALQSKVMGKSLRLDDTTYKYGKEYTFDDLTEQNLGNKSSYIVYLDENDYVLWVEEDEFSVEDYVLVERITIETVVNNVITKTASVLGTADTTADTPTTLLQNSNALQKAYNQSKDAVGNSSWDAQAQVRYPNGTRRTITLDDSKNYRTSAASDASVRVNTTTNNVEQVQSGVWTVKGTAGSVNIVSGTSGDDGNWIAEPFTAGHIVRVSSNSNGYRLHSININRFARIPNLSISGNKLYSGTSRQPYDLDSETHFVVEDNVLGTYRSYIGVKNVPKVALPAATVNGAANIHYGDNAVGYVYLNGTTAKLVFITNAWDVSNSSNDIVFLVANSTSNKVEGDDGVYYEVSAVEKNEIKTLLVKDNQANPVKFTGTKYNGTTYTFQPGNGDTEKEFRCVILNNVKYDSNDFITKGEFTSSDDTAIRYHGIRRVNDEELRVNTFFNTSTLKDVAENVRVYFVDGSDIEEIDYSEIVNDTTDYVYLVEDKDGEVTYIFIVNFDGDGDDAVSTPTTVTTYTDGQLVDTSNGAATAYTLHILSSGSAALAAVNPVSVQSYITAALASTYAPTSGNFQYNAALSSGNTYVFDWMTNGNASGIVVSINVATDSTPAATQPTNTTPGTSTGS